MGMNDNMRCFSRDLESRLDRVYKQGATKKFGYDSITNLSATEETKNSDDIGIRKMEKEAKQYIEMNMDKAFSKAGKKMLMPKEMMQKKNNKKPAIMSNSSQHNNDDIN